MADIQIVKDEPLFAARFISVVGRHYIGPDGRSRVWECVQRNTFGHPVIIVPITADGFILLQKQFRVPLNSYVLELPGGLMDKEGESAADVAARELLEETGYRANRLQFLGRTSANVGLQNEMLEYYAALDCEFVGEQRADDSEVIEVIKIPLVEFESFALREHDVPVVGSLYTSIAFLRRAGLL